jgi:hypothetical protein
MLDVVLSLDKNIQENNVNVVERAAGRGVNRVDIIL